MLKSKKAGCTTYADVNSEYMLFPSATTQTPKTGGKKGGNSFANDLMSLTDMLKTPQLAKGGNKKGGTFANDAVNFLKNMSSTSSTMASAQSSVTPPIATPIATTKAGCGSCSKKGGAIELAPFAAALAFLATRFATDKNFDMKKIIKSSSKSMNPSSKSMKSSSMRSTSKKNLSF